ncbi:MAG TPA: polysaccharide lyase family 7 protein [Chthoniobacteraceae bacterium]|jgi:hypothetical protein|nr:polysaccharide lyase family 7 protein [Chthoniobacteraceae bacterium]
MTLTTQHLTLFIGLVLLMAPPPASAADPLAGRTPPGAVPGFAKALAHFDLEIPVADSSGVVKITTITSEPAKGFAAAPGYATYFWAPSATEMIFRVPPNGATTPNSHFPRTELSQKKAERWKTAGGNHTLRGIFTLAAVPKVTDKGEITVAQIHDDVSDHGPLLKLVCDYKSRPWKLFAEYRTEPQKTSAIIRTPDLQRESITLNTPLEYEILLTSAHVLTVRTRKPGAPTWKVLAYSLQKGQHLDPTWEAETCYFKAGCYLFDPSPTDAPPAEVHYTVLAIE